MSSRQRRSAYVEDDNLDLSIEGDEVEQNRIRLENNLQDLSLQLSISNASQDDYSHGHSRPGYVESEASAEEHDTYSLEYPRHNPHLLERSFQGHASSFMDPSHMEDSHGANPYSFHNTGDDYDDAVHVYGGETMSTPGHHASHVTLSAGLGRKTRTGPLMDTSMSYAEYDPERPLENLVNGVVQEMSMFDMNPEYTRRKGHGRTSASHPEATFDRSNKSVEYDGIHRRSIHSPSQSGTPNARSVQLPHTNLGTALNRVGSKFSPRRPRTTRTQQILQNQPSPRDTHRRVHAIVDEEIPIHSRMTSYSKISKIARNVAKEIEVSDRWAMAAAERGLDNPLAHSTTKQRKDQNQISQRHPLHNIVNQPAPSDNYQHNHSAFLNHRPKTGATGMTNIFPDKQRLFPSSGQERQVQLPDVTGLTSALGSPGRALSEWQQYAGDGEEEDFAEAHLLQTITNLQTRLNQLESQNLVSRRRVRELEMELEACKAEVKRERTRVLEREEIIVAQQKEVDKRKKIIHKAAAVDKSVSNMDRYREVIAERKALEELVATLRSHLTRLTSELSSHQAFLVELRALRESDHQAMNQKLAEVDGLRAEVERLAGEVEVLRGVVEEGLKERRRAKEASGISFEPEEPSGRDIPDERTNNNDVSTSFPPFERASTPPSRQTTPRPLSQHAERTMRTDHATVGSSHLTNQVSGRYVEDDELDRLSEELEARRSERSRSSASSLLSESPSNRADPLPQQAANFPNIRNVSVYPAQPAPSRAGHQRHSRANNPEVPATPFPQIRGERLEKLFFSAPEHNAKTCALCHRRRRSGPSMTEAETSWLPRRKQAKVQIPGPAAEQEDEGFEEGDDSDGHAEIHNRQKERENRNLASGETLPPQTVLARVLRELEDDFTHYKGIYIELADQYKLMDAASDVPKRNVLAEHLKEVIDAMERKGDQIASLYDLLTFGDKPVEMAAAAKSLKQQSSAARPSDLNSFWSHPRYHRG